MPTDTQADRPMKITTPLGQDTVLPTGFRDREEISPHELESSLAAGLTRDVKFDGIVGQDVTFTSRNRDNSFRYLNAVVRRFMQQARDESVRFAEGVADQPIITGSVYNADNMPWVALPKNKQLGGFKSASIEGTAKHNIVGGGSGGGFDEGNPVPDPPPTGITGLNSVVTYGDQFQAAGPVAQQLTMGTNLQMCITTGGLIAGGLAGIASAEATLPPVIAQVIGSATGSMQFTIGGSAQFTLGQSYEISVGPPKIELHKAHSSFDSVRILSLALGLICEVFWYAYDAMKGSNNVSQYTNATSDAQRAAALASEESGDKERAIFVLAYQAVTEAMLIAIMFAEFLTDSADWIACDAAKVAYEAHHGSLGLWKATPKKLGKLSLNSTWSGLGQIGLGLIGIGATVVTELVSDSAQSQ